MVEGCKKKSGRRKSGESNEEVHLTGLRSREWTKNEDHVRGRPDIIRGDLSEKRGEEGTQSTDSCLKNRRHV